MQKFGKMVLAEGRRDDLRGLVMVSPSTRSDTGTEKSSTVRHRCHLMIGRVKLIFLISVIGGQKRRTSN